MQDAMVLESLWRRQVRDPLSPMYRPGANGPFFVLINGACSAEAGRDETALERYFHQAGVAAHFTVVSERGRLKSSLERTARLAGATEGTLVVGGGDGTINAALPYLLHHNISLGILPCGTYNYAARELGIPLDLKAAVEALVHGEVSDVPVGSVNGHYFLVSASLGLFSGLLEERARMQGRGRWAGWAELLHTLMEKKSSEFRLAIRGGPGQEREAAAEGLDVGTLFVGKSALQLREMGVEPHDSESELTAVALRAPAWRELFHRATRGAAEPVQLARDTLEFSFQTLTVTQRRASRRVKVALDGERLSLVAPLQFERAKRKLKVIVPAPTSERRYVARSQEPTATQPSRLD